jgi:hypothetical protein
MFNSKQLEELESASDTSSNIFESPGESVAGPNDNSETALAWRRAVLEEALANIKRSGTRPVDPTMTYEIGSLLFDRDNRRYARVKRSIPGFLDIHYLTGGDREYGKLNVKAYLKEFGETKSVTELALALDAQESEIVTKLKSLGLNPQLGHVVVEPTSNGTTKNSPQITDSILGEFDNMPSAAPTKPKKASKKSKAKQELELQQELEILKEDGTANDRRRKRAKQIAEMPVPSDPANPIDDPNTFIRQNFFTMSNRELARATGLSEHTIRRKLGEWKLKRNKKLPRKKA